MKNYLNFSYKYCALALLFSILTLYFFALSFTSINTSPTYFLLSWMKYLQEGLAVPSLSRLILPILENIVTLINTINTNTEIVLKWLPFGVFCLSSIVFYTICRVLKGEKIAYIAVIFLYSSLGSLVLVSHSLHFCLIFLGQQLVILGFICTLRHPAYWALNIILPLICLFLDTGNTLLILIFLSGILRFSSHNLSPKCINTAFIISSMLMAATLWADYYQIQGLFADFGYKIKSLFNDIKMIDYVQRLLVTFLLGLFPWNAFVFSIIKKSSSWEDILLKSWTILSFFLIPTSSFGYESDSSLAFNFQCLAPYSLLIGQYILQKDHTSKSSLIGFGCIFLLCIVLECILLEYIISLQNPSRFLIPFISLSFISFIGLFYAFASSLRHKFYKSLTIVFITIQFCILISAKMVPLFIDSTDQIFSDALLKYLKTEDDIIFYPEVKLYGIPYHTEHSIKFLNTSPEWPFYSQHTTLKNLENDWKSAKTIFLIVSKDVYIENFENSSSIFPFFILETTQSHVLLTNRFLDS